MVYRCFTIIQIIQQPTIDYPQRINSLEFDFVTEFESSDSWRDLTNKGKMTIPKNLFYKDQDGKRQPLKGVNINIGGFNLVPLFLRGDKVMIEAGYKYFNANGFEIIDTSIMFTGFITKVHSKIPIELDLEDNMWKLKQIAVRTKTFLATETLTDILKFCLAGSPYTFMALSDSLESTTFGEFQVGGESVAQVLQRLQKTYGFEFYFRGDQLRGGIWVYVESEAQKQYFNFQENIIEDRLEYMRKDDIVLSAVAHNTLTEERGGECKDGAKKTKHKRIEVLVTIKNGIRTDLEIVEGTQAPENIEGERRTFFFPGATTVKQLADKAYQQLIKYYYTGFKGNFTTFGIPFVKQGDNAAISDRILPERNGTYKIKEVEYSGGVDGLRQIVHLDYKLNVG